MPSAVVVISVVASCLPLLLFNIVLRWLGRQDRESFALLCVTLFWGAIGATFFGGLGTGLLTPLLASWQVSALGQNLLASPFSEEVAKGLILVVLFAAHRLEFATSGLFYGATTGLGFAMTENCLYFLNIYDKSGPEDWYINLIVRTIFATSTHVASSATFGFVLGRAHERRRHPARLLLAVFMGLFAAVSIHGLWNGTVFVGQATRDISLSVYLFLTVPFVTAILLGVTELALRIEDRVLLRELREEVDEGLISMGHAEIVASHLRRRGRAWLPADIPRDPYVRALCELALRKHGARLAGLPQERTVPKGTEEIAKLREEVRRLASMAR